LNRVKLSSGFPAPEVQLQIANVALDNTAAAVERAGEYFFLYRRGVERDVVPLDPMTGRSSLTDQEQGFIQNQPTCNQFGVTTQSLDIHLTNLECFKHRVENLTDRLATTLTRSTAVLPTDDTSIAFEDWGPPTKDTDGRPAYVFELPITFDVGQKGILAGQRKQKVRDMTFFIESNDSTRGDRS